MGGISVNVAGILNQRISQAQHSPPEKEPGTCNSVRKHIKKASGTASIILGLAACIIAGLALGGVISSNVLGIALMGIGGGSLLLLTVHSLSKKSHINKITTFAFGLLSVIWFTTLGALAFTGALSVTVVSWITFAPTLLVVGATALIVGTAACGVCCCGPCVCAAVVVKKVMESKANKPPS